MKARKVFDTLAYANRLKLAGLDSRIAETQAEANADMIANLIDNALLTKQDLSQIELQLHSEIKSVESKLESRINALESKLESRINALESKLESQIHETRLDLEKQIIQTESRLLQNMKELETRLTLRLGAIMIGVTTLAAALPSFLHLIK